MGQIKGTWKHESVPNVAIELMEIGNREPKKLLQNPSVQKDSISSLHHQ